MKSSPNSSSKILPFGTKAPALSLLIRCRGGSFQKKACSRNFPITSKGPYSPALRRMNTTRSGFCITGTMEEPSSTFLFPTPTSPAQNQSKSRHTTPVPTNPCFTMRAQSSASKTALHAHVIPKEPDLYPYLSRFIGPACRSQFQLRPCLSICRQTGGKLTTQLSRQLKMRSSREEYETGRTLSDSSRNRVIKSTAHNRLFQLRMLTERSTASLANTLSLVIRRRKLNPGGTRKYATSIPQICPFYAEGMIGFWLNVVNALRRATHATNTTNGNGHSFL